MLAESYDRSAWHPPLVYPYDDHAVTPRPAQLLISSRHPKREHIDPERDAEMNRETQARWRKNDKAARAGYNIACDSAVLDMLVRMGQILDHETSDPKIVGKAISDMLAEAAQAWNVR